MDLLFNLPELLLATLIDIFPIAAILFFFQYLVIRKHIANLKKVLLENNALNLLPKGALQCLNTIHMNEK